MGTPSGATQANRAAAILGAADGLTIVIALMFGHDPRLFHSALDAGIGEFVGMGAALYLSSDRGSFLAAFMCGLATLLGCVLPALPFLVTGGGVAMVAGSVVALVAGAVVCWLRPERGLLAVTETYGVLSASAVLCWLVSLIH